MPRMQRPREEGWALPRALTLAAAACWLAGLAVPFLKGSAKLLLVPIVREFNLPLFLDYLVDAGQGATAAPLAALLLFAPAAFLLWLAAALATHPRRRRLPAPPARAAGLLLLLNAGGLLAVRAGAAERATARLLPGAWLLLGGLALGTAAAAVLPRAGRRGARVPAGAPNAAAAPSAAAAKTRTEEE